MDTKHTVAVIGGGASGLVAAIACKRKNPALRVIVCDRMDKVGKKILATGSGQCNLANENLALSCFHGAPEAFLKPAFAALSLSATKAFFEGLGLAFDWGENGRIYPKSRQASAVLDVLRLELAHLGAEERCETEITEIQPKNDGFLLRTVSGETIACSRVIAACGGMASPHLGSNGSGYSLLTKRGHTLVPPFALLTQIKTDIRDIRALSGIKTQARLHAVIGRKIKRTEEGELLFTDYGLSGPPSLQLSRIFAAYFLENPEGKKAQIWIDFLPGQSEKEVLNWLVSRIQTQGHKALADFFTGVFQKRIGQAVFKKAVNHKLTALADQLSFDEIRETARCIHQFEIQVTGTLPFKNAQVTAGGMETGEFDANTLESKKLSGLYACGELLNVDGDCGGYNLQWAWSSGYLAGNSCAASIRP